MRRRLKSFFSVARFKRLASAYIISYLGTFLSLSFLAILFWSSVSSPSSISGVISRSGVEENLIFDIAKKSNVESIASGELDEAGLKTVIDNVFNMDKKRQINNEFSRTFYDWLNDNETDLEFSYDLSGEEQAIKFANPEISTDFLKDGNLVIKYTPDESSIKYHPWRTYKYFWWATLLSPILFVILAVILWFTYASKLDLLFKIKRMLYYSSIATLVSLPINILLWAFLASRLSSYPKAEAVSAFSVKPITNEILLRMSLVASLSFLVYVGCFVAIKKYLKYRKFEVVEEKHKNDVWEMTVKMTKYYLKKLR